METTNTADKVQRIPSKVHNRLIMVDYESSYEIFTSDQVTKDPGIINQPVMECGPIKSIKEIKPLQVQDYELILMQYELEQSVISLNSLIKDLPKPSGDLKELTEALGRVSIFIQDNIIKTARERTEIINRLLEFTEEKQNESKNIFIDL